MMPREFAIIFVELLFFPPLPFIFWFFIHTHFFLMYSLLVRSFLAMILQDNNRWKLLLIRSHCVSQFGRKCLGVLSICFKVPFTKSLKDLASSYLHRMSEDDLKSSGPLSRSSYCAHGNINAVSKKCRWLKAKLQQ